MLLESTMGAIYRNNRLIPAIIITACLWLFYSLLNPVSVDSLWGAFPQWTPGLDRNGQNSAPLGGRPTTKHTDTFPAAHVETRPTSTSSTVSPGATAQSAHVSSHVDAKLSEDDVLLIMKTGDTLMWKRLLIHLSTSLSSERIKQRNTVIYSDNEEKIGGFNIVDALVNATKDIKEGPQFDVYREQLDYTEHNVYFEAAGVDGDEWGPQGGWVIDKYKFVPLVQHAGTNWPNAKWYIYMEDDTYLFLPNVLTYLPSFDWKKPHWLGSYAAKSDIVFAHGGAGFALSRGAWEQSFGQNPRMAEDYEQYTADHCCGDQVLGHVLNKYGVHFGENGGDETFTYGVNPKIHWNFAF